MKFNLTQKEAIDTCIKAFKYGKYKQTTGCLRKTCAVPGESNNEKQEMHCGLGVICEEYMRYEDGLKLNTYGGYIEKHNVNNSVLPNCVQKWLGAKNDCLSLTSTSLVSLNDEKGFSFKKMGNWLVRNRKKLFNSRRS